MDYQGLGLATRIMEIIFDHPKLLQFDKIEGDAASSFSLRLMTKLGFEVVDQIEYEKMTTPDGERPFKDIHENLKRRNLSPDHIHFTFLVLDRTKLSRVGSEKTV